MCGLSGVAAASSPIWRTHSRTHDSNRAETCNFIWLVLCWLVFSLANFLSDHVEGEGFMTSTAARHQGTFKMFWLHFGRNRCWNEVNLQQLWRPTVSNWLQLPIYLTANQQANRPTAEILYEANITIKLAALGSRMSVNCCHEEATNIQKLF